MVAVKLFSVVCSRVSADNSKNQPVLVHLLKNTPMDLLNPKLTIQESIEWFPKVMAKDEAQLLLMLKHKRVYLWFLGRMTYQLNRVKRA